MLKIKESWILLRATFQNNAKSKLWKHMTYQNHILRFYRSIYRGYIWYDSVHSTTIAMIQFGEICTHQPQPIPRPSSWSYTRNVRYKSSTHCIQPFPYRVRIYSWVLVLLLSPKCQQPRRNLCKVVFVLPEERLEIPRSFLLANDKCMYHINR